jgi:hypothetical protein
MVLGQAVAAGMRSSAMHPSPPLAAAGAFACVWCSWPSRRPVRLRLGATRLRSCSLMHCRGSRLVLAERGQACCPRRGVVCCQQLRMVMTSNQQGVRQIWQREVVDRWGEMWRAGITVRRRVVLLICATSLAYLSADAAVLVLLPRRRSRARFWARLDARRRFNISCGVSCRRGRRRSRAGLLPARAAAVPGKSPRMDRHPHPPCPGNPTRTAACPRLAPAAPACFSSSRRRLPSAAPPASSSAEGPGSSPPCSSGRAPPPGGAQDGALRQQQPENGQGQDRGTVRARGLRGDRGAQAVKRAGGWQQLFLGGCHARPQQLRPPPHPAPPCFARGSWSRGTTAVPAALVPSLWHARSGGLVVQLLEPPTALAPPDVPWADARACRSCSASGSAAAKPRSP